MKLYCITVILLVEAVLSVMNCSSTRSFQAADGRVLQNSIAEIREVSIMQSKQTLLIRGKSKDAPVLLWLHGGPGGSEIGWNRRYLKELESDYIFVNWEQPGAGKSWGAVDHDRLTVQYFVDSALEVAEYLRKEFHQKKIYIAGHSWGSVIGLKAVHQRPELFHAYIGITQQVNSTENDKTGYRILMQQARAAGDASQVKTLESMGQPPYSVENLDHYSVLTSGLLGCPPGKCKPVSFYDMFFPDEYNLYDAVNVIRGMSGTFVVIKSQLHELDFEKEVPAVNVPVFFIVGRYDNILVQNITARYFASLKATHKRLYWFEQSGHFPCYEQSDKFIEIMRSDVLQQQHHDKAL